MARASVLSHPVWLTGFVGLVAAALTAIGLSRQLPAGLWWQFLAHPDLDDTRQLLIVYSFLPRLVTSLLCGAALSLAGTIFQQVMRNPLAEPTTLGISAGASLALSLSLAFAPGLLSYGTEWMALLGAGIAALAVFGLAARRALAPLTLVLAGLVVSLYCGALAAGVQLFQNAYMQSVYLWGAGSLAQQDWSIVLYLLPRLLAAFAAILLIVRPLALLGLADGTARSLGLSLVKFRIAALVIAVALSGVVVSAVGIIGFIGLAAPMLTRLAGARRLRQQIVWSPLLGAGLLCLTDQLVQGFNRGGRELIPTGAATALIGAPLLLWLLQRIHTTNQPPPTSPPSATTRRRRGWLLVACLAAALAVAALVSLHLGPDGHGWRWSASDTLELLLRWRAPRLFGALAAGAMLAAAGVLIQRMTGNPMASPEVLGISAGAALGVIAAVVLTPDADRLVRFGAGAAGALGTMAIILALGRRIAFAPERLLLTGLMVGALASFFLTVAMASGNPHVRALQGWMAGSTDLTTPREATIACVLAAILLVPLPFCRRWLDIIPLGPSASLALGLHVGKVRLVLLMLVAALTAAATLAIGPLGFVGLMAPHLARLMGLRRPLLELAGAAVLGALIMVTADWLGRTILFPYQVPAGLVATLIGGPYLMMLLQRPA